MSQSCCGCLHSNARSPSRPTGLPCKTSRNASESGGRGATTQPSSRTGQRWQCGRPRWASTTRTQCTSCKNIGSVLQDQGTQGDCDGAVGNYRKCLPTQTATLGGAPPQHPGISESGRGCVPPECCTVAPHTTPSNLRRPHRRRQGKPRPFPGSYCACNSIQDCSPVLFCIHLSTESNPLSPGTVWTCRSGPAAVIL